MTYIKIFLLLCSFSIVAFGNLETYLFEQHKISHSKLLNSISPEGTVKGVVIASPSKVDPPYFYHWVRDAALVMEIPIANYARAKTEKEKEYYFQIIGDYINLTMHHQKTNALTGLGEPKFNVDGSPYNGPWGRPQNDGPALRALGLSKFAYVLLNEGRKDLVEKFLYNPKMNSIIKKDLDYVVNHWGDPSFDLWEEVLGHHFYTRMVQRKSLLMGAKLAESMADFNSARRYREVAELLERAILDHWNANQNFLMTTFDVKGGADYKHSQLDTSQLLAVLHTHPFDNFLSPSDDRVLSTVVKLADAFKRIYTINQRSGVEASLGVAMGRYPEDRYYNGNPWVLTTHAVSEILYFAAIELAKKGEIKITHTNYEFYSKFLNVSGLQPKMIIAKNDAKFSEVLARFKSVGDTYMARVQYHKHVDGSMNEQMDRNSGFMLAAPDLTWSYASFITAKQARDQLDAYLLGL
jgi:glucoamylase